MSNFLKGPGAGGGGGGGTVTSLEIGTAGEPYVGSVSGLLVPDATGNTITGDGIYKFANTILGNHVNQNDDDGHFILMETNITPGNRVVWGTDDAQTGVAYPFSSNRVHQMNWDWSGIHKFKLANVPTSGHLFFAGWSQDFQDAVRLDDPLQPTIGFQYSPDPPRSDPSIMFMGHNGVSQNVLVPTGIAMGLTAMYSRVFITGAGTGAVLELLDSTGAILASRTWTPAEMPPATTRMGPSGGRTYLAGAVGKQIQFYYAKGVNPL